MSEKPSFIQHWQLKSQLEEQTLPTQINQIIEFRLVFVLEDRTSTMRQG